MSSIYTNYSRSITTSPTSDISLIIHTKKNEYVIKTIPISSIDEKIVRLLRLTQTEIRSEFFHTRQFQELQLSQFNKITNIRIDETLPLIDQYLATVDALLSTTPKALTIELIQLIFSEIRTLTEDAPSESILKANELLKVTQKKFPNIKVPKVQRYVFGRSNCLKDSLYVMRTFCEDKRLSQFAQVLPERDKWNFLQNSRKAYLRALISDIRQFKKYPFPDICIEELSFLGWDRKLILSLLTAADKIKTLKAGKIAFQLENYFPQAPINNLYLPYNGTVTEEILNAILKQLSNLEVLDITEVNVNPEKILFPLTTKQLHLASTNATDSFLEQLNVPELETLDLDRNPITLKGAQAFSKLKSISLRETDIIDANLSVFLENSPDLEILKIAETKITFACVASPKKLKTLDVSCNYDIKNIGLNSFINDLELENLNISHTNLSLENSKLSSTITELDLGSSKVTNTTLKEIIKQCPNLQILKLSRTEVSLEGIFLPESLKVLDISNTQVSNEALIQALISNPKLEILKIENTSISLKDFKLPKSMLELYADNEAITDDTLQFTLQGCNALLKLSLNDSNISLKDFTPARSLEYLSLRNCQQLKNEFLASTLQKTPGLLELHLDTTSITLDKTKLPDTLTLLNIASNRYIKDATLLPALKPCKNLQTLVLEYTQVLLETDPIPHTITALNMNNTKVKDTTLNKLMKQLPNLRDLELDQTDVTLKDVIFPEPLQHVSLVDNIKIQEWALESAKSKNSLLLVTRERP